MRRLGACAGLALCVCLGQARAGTELFRSLEIEADGGRVLPSGNLDRTLDPAWQGALRLNTSYYGRWRAHGELVYMQLDGPHIPLSLHVVLAETGLEWGPGGVWPSPGLGIGLGYTRIKDWKSARDHYFFLEDGESEFGIHPSLRWSLRLGGPWTAHAGGRWDCILSRPEYTYLASGYLGLGWKWK